MSSETRCFLYTDTQTLLDIRCWGTVSTNLNVKFEAALSSRIAVKCIELVV